MKKILIALVIILSVKNVSAQNGFGDCVKNMFMHRDSIIKLARNPFDEWKSCVLNKPMPNFSSAIISGDIIEMSRLKGKIVVVNFWFIDCHPCIAELPGLNKLVNDYKKENIVFLAITWETAKRIQNDFFPKYKLDFIIIPDAKNVIDSVAASGYPTTYIVNQQGIVKAAWNGGRMDDKAEEEYYLKAKPIIDELLKTE